MLKIQKLSEDGNGLIKNVQGKIGKPLDTKVERLSEHVIYASLSCYYI